jgi:hypothetical protein
VFRKLVSLALGLLLILGAAREARNDILFFDLNDSEMEVEAARQAARERGEKVVVVQLVEEEARDRIRELQKEQGVAERAKSLICKPDADSDSCKEAKKSVARVEWKSYLESKKMKKFGRNELFNAMAAVKKQNRDISSVVVSGHDGDRQLWGTYGSFNDHDLEDAMQANKPVADNVRALYLWGCYTATTDDFMRGWKKTFPNTAIAGFYGQSPLGKRKKSSTLLKDILVKERELLEARDRKELGNIFKSLSDVNGSSAAMCVNSDLVVNARGAHKISDDINICVKGTAEEEKWTKVYQCYFFAEEGCEDVPLETDGTNIIRRAYDYAQKTKHCEEVQKNLEHQRQLSPLNLRRLLFDANVRGNFELLHVKEISDFNDLVFDLGFPEKQLTLIGKNKSKTRGDMSRKEYMERMKDLKNSWNQKKQALKDSDGHVHDARVIAMGYYLDEFDKIQSGSCVPGTWVEENGHLDESPCGIRQGMRTALSRAKAKVAEYRAEERTVDRTTDRVAPSPPVTEPDVQSEPRSESRIVEPPPTTRPPRFRRASGQINGDTE